MATVASASPGVGELTSNGSGADVLDDVGAGALVDWAHALLVITLSATTQQEMSRRNRISSFRVEPATPNPVDELKLHCQRPTSDRHPLVSSALGQLAFDRSRVEG